MKQIFTLLLFSIICVNVFAQERYTEEVFTNDQIKVTSDVLYATNATILALLFVDGVDEFIPEPLFMDVYEPDPSVDTQTDRPMVMVVHGGDGLPIHVNNSCLGDKTDSVTVATARKLARMGYVAVAPNYRLGWNPTTQNIDAFKDGLVDAGVRVQQDLKACARHLRKDIAEDGNTFNIHPEKFGIWGTAASAGTYCGFAAYINEVEELQTETFFIEGEDNTLVNTFNEAEAGNIEGTVVGYIERTLKDTIIMANDTMVNEIIINDTTNYVNTPDYSSAFQISALGSAIAFDPGIIDTDEPPMIMFGNPNSEVTNDSIGPIELPTTDMVVAIVLKSKGLIAEANSVGVNDDWKNHTFTDPYSLAQQADPNFGGVEGWLPLYGDKDNEYPWVHWDSATCPVDSLSLLSFPGMDRDYALAQIDTMAGYFGVRACITLGLDCPSLTSIKEALLEETVVDIFPNPISSTLRIVANNGQMMESVDIYNTNLQLVNSFQVNNTIFQRNDLKLSAGVYSVLVRFNEGIASKKLVVVD